MGKVHSFQKGQNTGREHFIYPQCGGSHAVVVSCLNYPRGGGTDRRRSKACLNYPIAGALIGPSTAHGQYTGYYSLPALDYAVFKAGLLKLMPAFAEEAAPLDNAQGTRPVTPFFPSKASRCHR